MMVRVVTDSAADIPSEIVKELSITVVPDNVHFGQRTFRAGIDLTSEEFFAELAGSPVILPLNNHDIVHGFAEMQEATVEQFPLVGSVES